jgi:cytochrome c553
MYVFQTPAAPQLTCAIASRKAAVCGLCSGRTGRHRRVATLPAAPGLRRSGLIGALTGLRS